MKNKAAITFYHPVAFWAGTTAVIAGVLAHLPMYLQAADVNFRMAGMTASPLMTGGMVAIVVGTLACAYGLFPAAHFRSTRRRLTRHTRLRTLDDSPLTAAHWKLIAILVVALIVDVMKPATLGFVMPGSTEEYGLTKSQAALLPLGGIVGTVIGSLLWGYLGDVIGRRASILFAAVVFVGTSICGAMPSYTWNIIMCFLMGLGAGGMLPIAFALLAELIPARQRGWLIVLVGGIGTVGGYLAASGSAALLEPTFGWRILWFLGLPTGVMLLFLNRYIPESPRYLLVQGREKEAHRIMDYFRIENTPDTPHAQSARPDSPSAAGSPVGRPGNISELIKAPYTGLTAGLSLYGIAWGLVNFGFLLWLPLNLRSMGLDVAASNMILAKSAVFAVPATVVVAWLYHSWSTKNTMILFAMLTVAALAGFTALGPRLVEQPSTLSFLLVALLVSSSGTIAVLSPYTAEVYSSHIRATGSGWIAACSKGAGVVALGTALAGLTFDISTAAAIVAIPTLAAALLVARTGVETRGRRLEEIEDSTLDSPPT